MVAFIGRRGRGGRGSFRRTGVIGTKLKIMKGKNFFISLVLEKI